MFKSRGDRFDQVLAYVRDKFGDNAATIVDRNIGMLGAPQRKAIGDVLSMPGEIKGEEQRNGLRTLLFLLFTESGQPVALADAYKQRYGAYSPVQLKNEVQSRLPLFDKSPKRDDWDPANFTRATTKGPAPAQFRYIVFGMMNTYTGRGTSYADILKNPDILNSFALSTSVIDQDHVSTYYPYGFIIKAPKECILSTHPKDQAFKNYRAADPGTLLKPFELADLTAEIRRVVAAYPIKSPAEVLAGTTGKNGKYGYNEVVVLGTAPGPKSITVEAFFMKVDSRGKRFEYGPLDGPKGPFVTDEIKRKMDASSLPIVTITDTSGKNK